jgi:arylsulfatase A-like enzyme
MIVSKMMATPLPRSFSAFHVLLFRPSVGKPRFPTCCKPAIGSAAFAGARLFALVAIGSLLLSAAGCSRWKPTSTPGVTYDLELVDSDPGSFHQHFDGSHGKLVLGTGWYGNERIEKSGPWSSYSWAAKSAHVYFGVPLSHDVELVALLAPFVYPGSPPQTLTPTLNGTTLPSVTLDRDWQELRIPLPERLLRPPLNDLKLTFAYTAVPSKVIESDDTTRELAAAVHDLAVVPRGRPASAPESAVHVGGATREVTLQGEGLAMPLPVATRCRLPVGAVRSRDSPTTITVDIWRRGSRQTVWNGSPASLSRSALDFEVDGTAAPAMLLLKAQVASGSSPSPETGLTLDLGAPETSGEKESTANSGRPNIFLYVIDTLRADALGTYGSRLPESPRIDAFARDAVTYERAWSASSWTLPATVSILSGVYPFEHGMLEPGERLPTEGVPWLPELVSRLGYETVAISQWPLGRGFGLERGFGTFTLDARLMKKSYSELARGLFFQYLFNRPQPERPLFAYVHVSDPHAVYDPTGDDRIFADRHPGTLPFQLYNPQAFIDKGLGANPVDTAHLRALYDGEVLHADRQFGAFLDMLRYLGLYEQSLIILVSDHGEEFYEHGGFDHGHTLYEELLRVPLLVKYPGRLGAGTRVSTRVSTLDIPPTILALLGQHYGDLQLNGRSLPRSDGSAGPARELFAQVKVGPSPVQGPVDLYALVAGNTKCIYSGLPVDRFRRPESSLQIYDLAADPGEHAPLEKGDARVKPCSAELSAWVVRARTTMQRQKRNLEELPPEEIRRLRALGYLH